MLNWRRAAVLLVVGVGFAGPRAGAEPPVKLAWAQRPQVQVLATARRLSDYGQYHDAARLLDKLLASEGDFGFQPSLQSPQISRLKPAAERLLGELQDEVRAAYRLQFEAAARQALTQAVKQGAMPAVCGVAERWFHTSAGAEATYLVGTHYMDRAQPFHAAIWLARLRRHSHDAERFEPALSLRLAACLVRAGLPREAEQTLHDLALRRPQADVQIAGRVGRLPPKPDQALAWLAAAVGPASSSPAPTAEVVNHDAAVVEALMASAGVGYLDLPLRSSKAIYVVTQGADESRLVELSAENGRLSDQWTLAEPQPIESMEAVVAFYPPGWRPDQRMNFAFAPVWQPPPKPKRAVPDLVKDLEHADVRVRHAAAFALRDSGPEGKQAVPALLKALGDPDSDVRWVAAGSLGYVGSDAKEVVGALERTSHDPNESVRYAAVTALQRVKPAAKEAVASSAKARQDEAVK